MKGFYLDRQYIGFDFSQIEKQEKKALIFLLGIPGSPKDYAIFEDFKMAGFDIFLPRYEGTWESKGVFLEKAPSIAIDYLAQSLNCGVEIDGRVYAASKIYVVGTSFGGGVSLVLSDAVYIKAVCALSPVTRFTEVVGIESLEKYLKESESQNYRFNSDSWQKLITDQIYCPAVKTNVASEKILILGGENDEQILPENLEKYSKDKGAVFEIIPNSGHLTFSRLTKDLVVKILHFFSSHTS